MWEGQGGPLALATQYGIGEPVGACDEPVGLLRWGESRCLILPMQASTRIPLQGVPTVGLRPSPRRFDRRFWTLQFVVWPAYGAALMLPWLGTYAIASMVPNKLVVAGSGLLTSAGLRCIYLTALRRRPSPGKVIAIVVIASVAAGLAWDSVLAALLGGSRSNDLRRLGALGSGIPQFAGALYHALVLLTWSLAYLGLKLYRSQLPHPLRVETPPGTAASSRHITFESPPDEAPHRLVLRDGKSTVVLDAGEITWVEAAGDYVRVHAGPKRLLLRATMAGFEATLPANAYVRIHRSSIVRIAQVRELISLPNREHEVVLRDGTKLRASRTYAGRIRAVLGIGLQ